MDHIHHLLLNRGHGWIIKEAGQCPLWPYRLFLTAAQTFYQYSGPVSWLSYSYLETPNSGYYGMVTFMDEQVGKVLDALERSGQWENTRILYVSDHGEMLGEQGFFFKGLMHESSAGIPMIAAGPDIPQAHICNTPVNLVDVYPTVIQSVGAELTAADQTVPGQSLIEIARQPDDMERISFSEYHSVASRSATFMVRSGDYKYVHYHGQRPQLFNLVDDPHEANDLAAGESIGEEVQALLDDYEAKLHAILDPAAVDAECRAFQTAELERHGGWEKLRSFNKSRPYSQAPKQFA